MKIDFGGLIPATVLPMTADAKIDEGGLRRYMAHIAGQGIRAVAINVDTGEGPHLWQEERVRVIQIVADEIGDRVPIVAGLGAAFTEQAVRYAREYQAAGASAFLVFPIGAYAGLPLDAELPHRYHCAIADATGLPQILFHLTPELGGATLTPEVIDRLCSVAPVEAIKDASFDPVAFIRTRAAVKAARPQVKVLTGNDNFIYESFVLGAEGALLGFGAVPTRQLAEIIELALRGNHPAARELMDRMQPLEEAIFAAPMRDYRARAKEALVMQGILERATVREPLLPVSEADRERVRKAMIFAGELEGVALR
jgi:4-hydroxy-tetrahydrodipicolinate synthase